VYVQFSIRRILTDTGGVFHDFLVPTDTEDDPVLKLPGRTGFVPKARPEYEKYSTSGAWQADNYPCEIHYRTHIPYHGLYYRKEFWDDTAMAIKERFARKLQELSEHPELPVNVPNWGPWNGSPTPVVYVEESREVIIGG
jgi:hypothetical protein